MSNIFDQRRVEGAHGRANKRASAGRPRASLAQAQKIVNKPPDYRDSIFSVMIRDLDGSIRFWNRAAARHYGWSRKDAVGNVSHELLHTVFPCPLSEINEQLLSNGKWEGELIHSLSDGLRVKVLSRWELQKADSGEQQEVVEINSTLGALNPATAFLAPPLSSRFDFIELLLRNKSWWLWPFVLVLVALGVLSEFGAESVLVPLGE